MARRRSCLSTAGRHAHWWDFVGERLIDRYAAFSLDLRGHGDSGRPADGDYTVEAHVADLAAFLAPMGSRQTGVGGSFGRFFAALPYAVSHPEKRSPGWRLWNHGSIGLPNCSNWPHGATTARIGASATLEEASASYRFILPAFGATSRAIGPRRAP